MSRRAKIALLVFAVLVGAYCWANDWPALCWNCNRLADEGRAIKTAVRWCHDWRCQREERIERGEDEATKLKRALAEALEMVRMHSDDYDYVSPRERIAELRLLL